MSISSKFSMNANLNSKVKELFAAVANNDLEKTQSLAVSLLNEGRFLSDFRDGEGRTVVQVAVDNGHAEMAKYLLRQDSNLASAHTRDFSTQFHLLVSGEAGTPYDPVRREIAEFMLSEFPRHTFGTDAHDKKAAEVAHPDIRPLIEQRQSEYSKECRKAKEEHERKQREWDR